MLDNNVNSYHSYHYVRIYIKGKYAYAHLSQCIIRFKANKLNTKFSYRVLDRMFSCPNNRFKENEIIWQTLPPYYLYIVETYHREALFSILGYATGCLNATPDPEERNHSSDTSELDPEPKKSMISQENIISALTKNSDNTLVTGVIKHSQEAFVGIPILHEGAIKIFVRKKVASSKSIKNPYKKAPKIIKNQKPLFKWNIYNYDEVTVVELEFLGKNRLTESNVIRMLNHSETCFNIQFCVKSLEGEKAKEGETVKLLREELFNKKQPIDLRGVLIQKEDKKSIISFVTTYFGAPLTFPIETCTLFTPSLKGFNFPKSRQKTEGATAKIIRNKRTVFSMDEEVKILKIDKNSKTPQRHYFTVQSLSNPAKISTVYSHNLKVI